MPVLNCVMLQHANPRGLLREIVKALAGYPERVLRLAAGHFTDTRKKLVSKKDVVDAIKAVLPIATIKLPKGTPGYAAWVAHYVAKGQQFMRRNAEDRGHVEELTEFPPGHWQTDSGDKPAVDGRAA